MSESDGRTRPVIPQELMLSRLAQAEQMQEFFVQMWLQNPALARQGGARVQCLVSPIETDAIRAGLRDLGYVEGRNIVIE